jgi:hypothetical protein
MSFFKRASEIYEIHGGTRKSGRGASDVLLEITPVTSHVDVHQIVDRVNERALAILTRQLHYPLKEAFQFSVMLSEVCQNIIEHAEAGGWVATQTYNWAKRLGRKVVSIAVVDLGVGFYGSLASEHAGPLRRALERRVRAGGRLHPRAHPLPRPRPGPGAPADPQAGGPLERQDRHPERHRPHRRCPAWDDALPLEEDLPPFPGSQISIILPSRVAGGARPGKGEGERPRGRSHERVRHVVPLRFDMSDMVRRSVATLYSHLVTRPTGRRLRLGIEAQITELGALCITVLDFSEVVVLDYSCADETVAKLIQRFQRRPSRRGLLPGQGH